ncbi:MAG: enolase C-terminal domain-like protein, partial [Jiangellaceae bacterium]
MIGAETGELHVYAVPLRRRFRGIDVRQGVLIHGEAGWGEFSPFAEYDDAEAAAWWRAAEEAAGIGWPPPVRDKIPVNATVPAVPAAEVAAVMAAFPGCGTAKVKIAEPGQTAADDQARLEAVRAVLGSAGHIRVDANGGWDLDMAARYLPLYDRAVGGLEYAEQPCATVEDMAALRRRVDIPIAADESIRR